MEKKTQNKKLNKKDHKKISDGVKNAKIGIGCVELLITTKVFIKKYGGQFLNISKKVISK